MVSRKQASPTRGLTPQRGSGAPATKGGYLPCRMLPRLCCPCMTSRWRTPWVRQTRRTAGLAVPPAQMDTEYH